MSHHHHHHCDDHSCCHGDHHDSCCSHHHDDSCCHDHEQDDFAQELLLLADEAWMELLKEKIKDQIQASSGKHMDKLAKLISTSNGERWKDKMEIQKTKRNFRSQINDFFSQHKG